MSLIDELDRGNAYPFEEIHVEGFPLLGPTKPEDWAHAAARGVASFLQSHEAVGHMLEYVELESRKEFVDGIAKVIREAEKRRESYGNLD